MWLRDAYQRPGGKLQASRKPEGALVLPISIKDVPPLPAPHLLRFWTSSALLSVEYHENEPGTGRFLIPLSEGCFDATILLDTGACYAIVAP